MKGSVGIYVDAPPIEVWALVSDVTNTGRFSPETFGAEWLDGATAPARGVRFRGHVRRNNRRWLVYWTTCVITACEPGREFAFDVLGPWGRRVVTWRYVFEPAFEGTQVTESFRLGRSPELALYALFAGRSRTRTNLRDMTATLEQLKTAAEARER